VPWVRDTPASLDTRGVRLAHVKRRTDLRLRNVDEYGLNLLNTVDARYSHSVKWSFSWITADWLAEKRTVKRKLSIQLVLPQWPGFLPTNS
jgi:hypothetical protein